MRGALSPCTSRKMRGGTEVATLRRLHPAPPAIKASAIVKGRILFATSFIFPFYPVLPDTLLGAVRCISKETSLLPTATH
jgi:hypothetical protein